MSAKCDYNSTGYPREMRARLLSREAAFTGYVTTGAAANYKYDVIRLATICSHVRLEPLLLRERKDQRGGSHNTAGTDQYRMNPYTSCTKSGLS